MKYVSTRGKSPAVSASAAIIRGLAPDGGLYVPERIPALDLTSLRELDYRGRAEKILKLFLTDFTDEEIAGCVSKAYTAEKFETEQIVPVHTLHAQKHVLELWHGPTCAFKDMALQILPHLLSISLKKQGEGRTAVILVATSGDTGKAALEGFCDAQGTKILVFYPSEGVSLMQKLQMITQKGGNVCACGITGNFDDAQNGVKAIFADAEICAKLDAENYFLSSANSINWGRLVPQIVYYVDGYLKLCDAGRIGFGDKINIAVPTGNFGNILAAYIAMRMGLPVNKLICASNTNDVLTDFIRTGKYDRRREFYATISPSMDILISSNLERMLWYLTGEDGERVAGWMDWLKTGGYYEIDENAFTQLGELFWGGRVNEEDTRAVIKNTWEQHGYLCDPHTAVAVGVYEEYLAQTGDRTPVLIASTASIYKFGDSVLEALGVEKGGDDFENLTKLEGYGQPCPKQIKDLREMPVRFPEVIDKNEMAEQLFSFI